MKDLGAVMALAFYPYYVMANSIPMKQYCPYYTKENSKSIY